MRDFIDASIAGQSEVWGLLDDNIRTEISTLLQTNHVDYRRIVVDIAFWSTMSRQLGGTLGDRWQEQRRIGLELASDATRCLNALRKVFSSGQRMGVLDEYLLINDINFDEMLRTTHEWSRSFEELGAGFKRVKSPKGRPGSRLGHEFVRSAAVSWMRAKGKAPSIDRSGKFLRYLEVLRLLVPADCRPTEFSSETVKKWLSKDRATLAEGLFEF